MTSGHREGEALNERLAVACARHGWMLGCGSQRRELTDPDSHREWVEIKQKVPELRLMGNLGLSQLVKTPIETVQALVDRLGLVGFFIHTNPLQECLQPEGSPQFRGGLDALRRLCVNLSVPVVLKETGSGFSMATLRRLKGLGLAAVDVSGLGGTHWGRVEGLRADPNSAQASAGHTFGDWGTSTVESLLNGRHVHADYELWASGGVRTGLDVAKLLAMGARRVGVAQPILRAALMGVDELSAVMEKMDFELRVALFCTGSASVDELREKKQWRWR